MHESFDIDRSRSVHTCPSITCVQKTSTTCITNEESKRRRRINYDSQYRWTGDTHDTLLTALLSNIAKHGLLHKSSKQASLNTSSFPINHDLFTSLIFVVCRPTQTRTCFAKPQIPDRVTAVALKATVWCSTRTSMCSWWRPEEIVHTSLDQQPKHNSKPHGEPYGKSITLSARIAKLQRQVTDAV